MKIHNSVKITAVTMNFAVKITSPFPYLSLKSTAGALRYFSVHDKMKFHDLLSFCYHSQRWNFEAEQRQLRLDQHSRLRFLPQSGFGNLWRIWLLSKPVGKTPKTSFFYFKKSKYGSNSPHMSLIKIADRCASSSAPIELLRHQSAGLHNRCMKPLQSFFSLVSRHARYSRLRRSRVTRARLLFPADFRAKERLLAV